MYYFFFKRVEEELCLKSLQLFEKLEKKFQLEEKQAKN
jgi:hypothetical protein